MHTVLDLRGSIPESIYITDSPWHDSNFLDVYEPHKWAIYTMDKAYVDFDALYRMHLNETNFVTRAKDTMKYVVVDTNYNINEMVGIASDQIIRLSGYVRRRSILRICAWLNTMILRRMRLSHSLPTTWSSVLWRLQTSIATGGRLKRSSNGLMVI